MTLTQEEAISLFAMRKIHIKELTITFPDEGERLEIELSSDDKRFNFQADINRKGHKQKRLMYQNRANKVYVLRRLDFLGAPHGNPPVDINDELLSKYVNKDIPCPHIHIYIEGFNDKWAVPLNEIVNINVNDKDDAFSIMEKFFQYCNIEMPKFKNIGMFTKLGV